MNESIDTPRPGPTYPPVRDAGRLAFYHPNRRGDGHALRLELKLARSERDQGHMFLEMARQKPGGPSPSSERQLGAFDWENKVTVKLGFTDLCEILGVLEGIQDQAGGKQGLYHATPGVNTLIGCRRSVEPAGVWVDISRKSDRDGQGFKGSFLLRPPEALGLRCVLQYVMAPLAFPGLAGTGNLREADEGMPR